MDAAEDTRPPKDKATPEATLLRQENAREMIFVLLVAGAYALATLRRFGGTNGYSDDLRVVLEFRPNNGIKRADKRPSSRQYAGGELDVLMLLESRSPTHTIAPKT